MRQPVKEPPIIPFKHLVSNPRAWQNTAHDLICAANILCEAEQESDPERSVNQGRRPIVWRTLMMLYGLAAENLIKAIIVAKNPALASSGTKNSGGLSEHPVGPLPNWFKKHNLLDLARQRAGLRLSRIQRHLLERLQYFVECGKYPVGRREGEGKSTFVSLGSSEFNDVLYLLEYLESELQRVSDGFVIRALDLRRIHREGA